MWWVAWALLALPLGAVASRYCRYAAPGSCTGTYHHILGLPDPETPEYPFSIVTVALPAARKGTLPEHIGSYQTADMDGDGWMDVICLHYLPAANATDVVMLQNGGSHTRKPVLTWHRVMVTVPGRAWAVAAADLNGDGLMDLVVAVDDGLRLYWGVGKPAFSAGVFELVSTEGLSRRGLMQLADVDGDGLWDIVMTHTLLAVHYQAPPLRPDEGLIYLHNTGNRSHPSFQRASGGADPFRGLPIREAFFLYDLDGDGDLDLGFRETNLTASKLLFNTTWGSPAMTSKTRFFENVGNASLPRFQEQITILAEAFPSQYSEYLWLPRASGKDPHAGDSLLRVSNDLVEVTGGNKVIPMFNFIDLARDYPNIPFELTALQGIENPFHGLSFDRMGGPRLLFVDADMDGDMDVLGAGDHFLRNVGLWPQQPTFEYRPTSEVPLARLVSGLLNESWAVGVGDLTGDGGSDLVSIRAKDGAVLWQKNAGAWQMEPARVLLPAFPGFKAGVTSPPPRLVVMSVDGRSPKTNKATPDVLVLWHKREEGVTGTLLVATVLFNDGDDKTGPLVQRTYSQVLGTNNTMKSADAYDVLEREKATVLTVLGGTFKAFTFDRPNDRPGSALLPTASAVDAATFRLATTSVYGMLLVTFMDFTLPEVLAGPFFSDLNRKGMPSIIFEGAGTGISVIEWGKCGFDPRSCSMHGVCMTKNMLGTCLCMDGYAGPRCSHCAIGYAPLATSASGGAQGGLLGELKCVSCASLGWGEHSTSDGDTCRCLESFRPSPSDGRCMCPPGYGYEANLKQCVECPRDHFRADYTLDPAGCKACPAPLVTAGVRSSRPEDCVCRAGFYMSRHGECKACDDKAMVCTEPGVSVTNLTLREGAWREDKISEVVLSCIDDKACRAGKAVGDDLCTGSRVGPLCSLCEGGSTLVVNVCQRCSATVALLGVAAAIAFFGVLSLLARWAHRRLGISGVGLVTKLRICLSMYQILSAFKEVFDTLSSSLLDSLSDNVVMQLLNGKVLSGAFALSCAPGYSFAVMLVLYVTVPIAIVAGLALWAGLRARCSADSGAAAWHVFQEGSFLVVNLVYLGVSDAIFRALEPCDRRFDYGRAYFRSDYSIECSSRTYANMRRVAVAALLLYPIGVPVIMAALLFWHRKDIRTQPQPASVAFLQLLYEPYKPEVWYFEVVETLRKMIYAAVFIAGPNKNTNMIVLLLLTIGFESLLTHLRPYQTKADQAVAEVAQWQLALTIVVTITLSLSTNLSPLRRLRLESIIILLQTMVVVAVLVVLAKEIHDKWLQHPGEKGEEGHGKKRGNGNPEELKEEESDAALQEVRLDCPKDPSDRGEGAWGSEEDEKQEGVAMGGDSDSLATPHRVGPEPHGMSGKMM